MVLERFANTCSSATGVKRLSPFQRMLLGAKEFTAGPNLSCGECSVTLAADSVIVECQGNDVIKCLECVAKPHFSALPREKTVECPCCNKAITPEFEKHLRFYSNDGTGDALPDDPLLPLSAVVMDFLDLMEASNARGKQLVLPYELPKKVKHHVVTAMSGSWENFPLYVPVFAKTAAGVILPRRDDVCFICERSVLCPVKADALSGVFMCSPANLYAAVRCISHGDSVRERSLGVGRSEQVARKFRSSSSEPMKDGLRASDLKDCPLLRDLPFRVGKKTETFLDTAYSKRMSSSEPLQQFQKAWAGAAERSHIPSLEQHKSILVKSSLSFCHETCLANTPYTATVSPCKYCNKPRNIGTTHKWLRMLVAVDDSCASGARAPLQAVGRFIAKHASGGAVGKH